MNNPSITSEAESLQQTLGMLRLRGYIFVTLGGLFWVAAVVLVLFSAQVIAMGWWGGEWLRLISWTVTITGLFAATSLGLLKPLFDLLRPHAVARRIGHARPSLASGVLSASELAEDHTSEAFSAGLLEGHLRTAGELIRSLPKGIIYSVRLLTWPAFGLCVALIGAASAYSFAPGLYLAGLNVLVEGPRIVKDEPSLRTMAAPILGDLAMTLRYPGYLARPERTLETTSGCLVAPLGTTVILEGKALVPGAKSGAVHLPQGVTSPLSVDSAGAVTGSFVLLAPGPFSFSLQTDDVTVKGMECSLEVERDPPPSIKLIRPAMELEIDAHEDIVFEFEAEDDHGLKSVDLVIRESPGKEIRKTILRLARDVRKLKTSYRWSPGSIRFSSAETIELELEAFDDDTIMGPKPGRTPPIHVRVMTPVSRHQSALREQNKALDALLDLLSLRLTSPVRKDGKDKMIKERMSMLERETEDALGILARLIHSLSLDSMSPKRVIDTFAQIRESLANQLMYESRLNHPNPRKYDERRSVDRATLRILEEAILKVDDLIVEQQLGRMVSTGGDLEKKRSKLTRLIEGYARTRKEAARRAVIDVLDQMQQMLHKLEREAESVRGRAADTFVNPSAMAQIDVGSALEKIRSLLASDQMEEALALAKRLESDLGRLMAGLEGGLLAFRTEHFGEGDQFVAAILDRVMTVESEQLQLKRETVALQRRYQERLLEVMRGKIDALVDAELEATRSMAKHLMGVEMDALGQNTQMLLIQLKVAVREIEMALNQGDLDETREGASKFIELAGDWALQIDAEAPEPIRKSIAQAEQIVSSVTEAYPGPNQLLSSADRRRARALSVKQRVVRSGARKLKVWIREEAGKAKFVSNRALSSLTKVTRGMDKSINRLEKKSVRDSLGYQTQALDELAKLREDLKRGNEVMPIEGRPVVVRGMIELPSPDEFQVPPEFRHDILRAMKSGMPDKYQEAIKRYYETLVK